MFTGPQASGKSIALQTLKLVLDRTAIVRRMADQGLTWRASEALLELYFGAGMHSLWTSSTITKWDRRPVALPRYPSTRTLREADEQVSKIFAQRAMSLRDGWTRSFGEYQAEDPYALRE